MSPEHLPLDTGQPHRIDNLQPAGLSDPNEGHPLRARLFNHSAEPRMFSHALAAPGAHFLLNSPSPISMSAFLAGPSFATESAQRASNDSKGKAVSRSIPIQARLAMSEESEDLFAMSPDEPSSPVLRPAADDQLADPFDFFSFQPVSARRAGDGHEDEVFFENSQPASPAADDGEREGQSTPFVGKGKGRDIGPPILPPLSFTPMEVGYGRIHWPSPASPSFAGPSSYGSMFSAAGTEQVVAREATPPTPNTTVTFGGALESATSAPVSPAPTPTPRLARSMSNLSARSARSLSTKIKDKFNAPKSPATLAKKLLSRKRDGRETPSSESVGEEPESTSILASAATANVSRISDQPSLPRTPIFDLEVGPFLPTHSPIPVAYRSSRDAFLLKSKSRSYSSPFPVTSSILDVVPPSTADLFVPIQIAPVSHFDDRLPRELKLLVFASLVQSHEDDHERALREGKWTVLKASSSKHRWVGKDKGVRELVRLGRVSKSWLALSLDGQLWAKLDVHSFPRMHSPSLLRIAEIAGSFIQNFDMVGQASLSPATLQGLTDRVCLTPSLPGGLPSTQLTHVNLRGCSAVTTRSLHHLLIRSPCLERLCVKGLNAVTNTTCDILAVYCPRLRAFDASRCGNMDGGGLRALATAALERGEHLPLTELRVSGLKYVSNDLMGVLGRAAPHLEVLDMSCCHGLHNNGLRAFVACSDADVADRDVKTVRLTSREAGYDPTDPTKHWRRVTRLRHLVLSSCGGLTDGACKHLAHAVPHLEFLELAGIGPALRDEGVVHLLKTTPLIRRLDLEDASSISDTVLATLTPEVRERRSKREPEPEPGAALEHLCLSHVANVSDDALSRLIQRCTHLRVLEADNTRMSGRVLQEFVRAVRRRGAVDAVLAAGDNRNVGESAVREVAGSTRPRLGWRAHDARRLGFLDARDNEGLGGVGQDECDPLRVVVKTFYSWQTVDAVRAARKKRAKAGARRAPSWEDPDGEGAGVGASRTRWWSPSGRRSPVADMPTLLDARDGEACIIM